MPACAARGDPPCRSVCEAPPTENRIVENLRQFRTISAASYVIIDFEEIRLPEGDLNLAHGVVFGESVLVNNLKNTQGRLMINEKKDINFTWRTTVLVSISAVGTEKVKVSLYMGL